MVTDREPAAEGAATPAASPNTVQSLEDLILGEERTLTAADVAEAAGSDLSLARRMWRALGFPEFQADLTFTPSDVDALRTVHALVRRGLIDEDTAVALTRANGQTMARLADWQVAQLVDEVQRRSSDDGLPLLDTAVEVTSELISPMEKLILYTWRRHLAAAAARMEALGPHSDNLSATELTVGFADIVSFTALSNEIGERRTGDVVEKFESRCGDVVAKYGGRVIKSLGDSVLFVNRDPLLGFKTAEGVIQVIGRDSRMPDVRVGVASGSVTARMGDVYGPPVNLAARLTSVARKNHIIVDDATARALPSDQFETRPLPERPVRGFGVLQPMTVRRR